MRKSGRPHTKKKRKRFYCKAPVSQTFPCTAIWPWLLVWNASSVRVCTHPLPPRAAIYLPSVRLMINSAFKACEGTHRRHSNTTHLHLYWLTMRWDQSWPAVFGMWRLRASWGSFTHCYHVGRTFSHGDQSTTRLPKAVGLRVESLRWGGRAVA